MADIELSKMMDRIRENPNSLIPNGDPRDSVRMDAELYRSRMLHVPFGENTVDEPKQTDKIMVHELSNEEPISENFAGLDQLKKTVVDFDENLIQKFSFAIASAQGTDEKAVEQEIRNIGNSIKKLKDELKPLERILGQAESEQEKGNYKMVANILNSYAPNAFKAASAIIDGAACSESCIRICKRVLGESSTTPVGESGQADASDITMFRRGFHFKVVFKGEEKDPVYARDKAQALRIVKNKENAGKQPTVFQIG